MNDLTQDRPQHNMTASIYKETLIPINNYVKKILIDEIHDKLYIMLNRATFVIIYNYFYDKKYKIKLPSAMDCEI